MFLKSLELQGFKSFPDKTVLRFDKGITAVVGPNGSGKSNISDAIRWVLGEMSAKSLRGSRMEDVIFGGTVTRRAQGFAEVTLSIDNGGHELPVDGEEIRVTRRYYRSGESEYLLNGTEVRLRDIYELFMDTGLGRDGYSVIGQGRIAEIVGAKSEDRREIFEEAAGISKYRYRKEDSERRLAAAEENLARLRDILSELESRVGPLREQSEKAKKYLALAADKKTLEVGLWLHTLDRQREALREHENRLELARAQYEEIGGRLDDAAQRIENTYLEAQKAAAQADSLRAAAQSDEEAAVRLEAQTAVVENDIARNDGDIERIHAEMREVENLGQAHEAERTQRHEQLAGLEAKLTALRGERAECERGAFSLSAQSEQLSARWEEISAALGQRNAAISSAKLEQNTAEAAAAHIAARLDAIGGDTGARESRRSDAQRALTECDAQAQKAQEKEQALVNSLHGYELKENSRRERLHRIEEQERTLSLQASGRLQRANMLADLERNLEGFSHSVRMVMRESAHGRLTGVDGPVSRVIRTPAAYAVAVETALGAAAQHIVVENEEDAKAAIACLKRNDGGRATFLPLTSIHGSLLNVSGCSACEGYVGIAAALLDYDARYEGIVRSLLGRTVVARDLDCAVAMARQFRYGFRIVTLDGQLVNAGGSLTGGSSGKNAGLLTRTAEIETLRQQAAELGTQLEKTRGEKKTAEAELAALEASVSGVRGELKTVQEDRIRLEAEHRRLAEQAQALTADIDALEAEQTDCTRQLAEQRALAEGAAQRAASLEQEAQAREDELSRLGADRGAIEKQREEQSARLTVLRLDIVGCDKDAQAVRQAIGELERQASGRSDRIEELKRREEELRGRSAEAAETIRKLKADAQALHQKAEESRRQAEEKAQERQQIEQRGTQLRAAERSLTDDREKISKELARLEERKTQSQAEYDTLISRLWEEYELTRSQAEQTVPRITDAAAAQKTLTGIRKQIKDLGDVNVGAIEEYKEVSQRYDFLKAQTDDVEKSRAELDKLIGDLTASMRDIFARRFEEINRHFSHTFVELFGGGSASLRLTDPEDVLGSGIEIIVQPPGKIIKSLAALSGGEQSFVAIALYFAILKVRPSPFCVLDEIEAALDDANVQRYAAYLRRMCGSTQFIVITHRRGTMEEADVLYGVTMQDEGVSKLLRLNVDELAEKLGFKP